MLIEEQKLKHWIDNFYGYGSWEAKFWFVSLEESGGELPEEVAEKVNYFYDVHPRGSIESLCDVREMYKQVSVHFEGPKAGRYANRFEFRFGKEAVLQGVWKNLISFVHGYLGQPVPDLLSYQRTTFAQPSAKMEALIPLYPLPSSNHHAWYYSWLDMPNMKFLKSRVLYQEHFYETRINTLLSQIAKHKPELVLMYGMENINDLKKSVQKSFEDTNFKQVKAVKLHTPQHHRADLRATTLLITTQIPALRHGRVETGFEWEEFGKAMRSTVS